MFRLVSAFLLVAGCWFATAASAQQLYKWVDEEGNVTYQDSPPPAGSGIVGTLTTGGADETEGVAFPDIDVTLFSIEVCESCDLVRELLERYGIPFEEKIAEGDAEVQDELRGLIGSLSVPLLTIGDELLSGYNRALILNELEEAGFAILEDSPGGAIATSPGSLTREDLEGMTYDEIEEAARAAAANLEDNDLFEEDEGFITLNEDLSDLTLEDELSEAEEIPADEQIQVTQ